MASWRQENFVGSRGRLLASVLRFFLALVVLFPASAVCTTCALCHPKEAAGFATTPMAHSLSIAGPQPDGAFDHPFSQTRFTIRNTNSGVVQTWTRKNESASITFRYIVGSGEHAFGYLAQVGDHCGKGRGSRFRKSSMSRRRLLPRSSSRIRQSDGLRESSTRFQTRD